jgi:RNA polymerase-binding transcription factor
MNQAVRTDRDASALPRDRGALDPDLQATLRGRLESAREAALRRLEQVQPEAPAADAAARSDAVAQQTIDAERDVQRILRHAEVHDAMEPIVDALDRLDDGTFGLCVECEEPIGEARLLALPYASRCLSCQEERDRDTR